MKSINEEESCAQITASVTNNDDRDATKKSRLAGIVSLPPRLIPLLQKAAAIAVKQDDPWSKCAVAAEPAELVIRHLYDPITQQWTTDETIIKIEKEPFTNGAMRYCYRMKKRAQPPASASNHRFHRMGWSYASNYVAKAYVTEQGQVDCSDTAKRAVQNDILLQYEAQHWAEQFNNSNPPSKIIFIRAYAIEFPNRPGSPWMAVERFIAGTDMYGAGFVKHNTNSGYVDKELRRVTPQVFSAHSFYASNGNRLVADIQGVGDLYTDPMVLSQDYRFGDGDLGPRGMALFFNSFRPCGMSDSLGLPIFALSKNELKVLAKYEGDEETISMESERSDDDHSLESEYEHEIVNAFQRLDLNRKRRALMLLSARDLLSPVEKDTERRSNLSSRINLSQSIRKSLVKQQRPVVRMHRTSSDLDEVQECLRRAQSDLEFTYRDYHRNTTGDLKQRQFKDPSKLHKSAIVRAVSAPILINTETRINLGRVHYQLAILHGMGRFPETVPIFLNQNDTPLGCSNDGDIKTYAEHDVFSVLFHLSYAAALLNSPACLALGRLQSGLESSVSNLLHTIIPTDFDGANILLRRAMMTSTSFASSNDSNKDQLDKYASAKPKAAAGCLLFQILHDESHLAENKSPSLDSMMIEVLKETLQLLEHLQKEENAVQEHKRVLNRGHAVKFCVGDRVKANYALEGSYYPATVQAVEDDMITVCYDDDGSTETLPRNQVLFLVPPTATQTSLGGPLTDDEAFAKVDGDDSFSLKKYELLYDLAEIYERTGKIDLAVQYYEEAADGAMADGKMKTAAEWSLKAGSL